VGRIVVQHDVHLCRRGKLGIQMVEKFLKFARAMTSKTFSNYIAGGYLQGRNREVVPCRWYSWLLRSACPGCIGKMGWVRFKA